jgi:hypothetical protein
MAIKNFIYIDFIKFTNVDKKIYELTTSDKTYQNNKHG